MNGKGLFAAAGAAGAYLFAISPRLSGRPERMPKVYYAHRGLHDNGSDAPENTLAAFAKAAEAGYGMELDVQLTRDGQVVVAHDFDLDRLCGVAGAIDSFTYEELQQFPVYGSSQHIPLFSDVLALVDGRVPLIVELKYKEGSRICEKAQALLDVYEGCYCVESFHPAVLRWYKENRPSVCRGQLSMNYQKNVGTWAPDRLAATHLLENFMTRPDFIAYDWHSMRALSMNICRKLYGCPSVAWTVTSQAELEKCRRYFDYFIFEGFIPEN